VVVPLSLLPGLSRAVTSASGEGRGSRLPLPSPSLPPPRGAPPSPVSGCGGVGRPRPGARHALARPPRSPPGPRGPRAGTGDVGGARGRGRWRERGGAGFSRSPPRARRPPSQGGVGEVRGDGRPVPLPFFFPPSRPRGRPAVPPDLASAPLRSAPLRPLLSRRPRSTSCLSALGLPAGEDGRRQPPVAKVDQLSVRLSMRRVDQLPDRGVDQLSVP
jgi:hypothetical protein